MQSLFKKTTSGESMPSRHTASAFIIAITVFYFNRYLGIVAIIIATLIALSRVLAGVHFIRDVLAGLLISAIIGTIFLFLV